MNNTNPKVDAFLKRTTQWHDETEKLRTILLECKLTEELKWGKPCYSFEGNNIAIIQGFKENCALMFFKGALMKDPKGVLEKPGESSQAARRIMFTSTKQIATLKGTIKAYVHEAIELEKAGSKVTFAKNPEPIPAELEQKMADDRALKNAFYALTPGRQRAYILHFSAPKQSKTRASRIEKCTQQILAGKGLNDLRDLKSKK